MMAEIEYFVDPENKTHKKFSAIKDLKLPLWSYEKQKKNESIVTDLTIEEAVNVKLLANETLAYFIGKTYLFLVGIGLRIEGIRFRQHAPKEMAHYALDCWDAEVETSYGWIEVAGHADRTCYDLSHHSEGSNVDLVASRLLKEPIIKKMIKCTPNKTNIFKNMKDKAKASKLVEILEKATEEQK